MDAINVVWLIFSFALGFVAGFLISRFTGNKSEGTIEFYMQPVDDDLHVIQCSVKPDTEWEYLMDRHSVIFKIEKTKELEEALKKNQKINLKEKEN